MQIVYLENQKVALKMRVKFSLGFFLVVLIFLIKGIYLIFIIPPWEAPDETSHVAYVFYLFNYKKIPSSQKPFVVESIISSLLQERKIVSLIKKNRFQISNRIELFDRNEKKLNPPILANLADNPPLYYLYLLPFYKLSLFFSSYWSLIFLRIGSLILGVFSLLLVYSIAKKLYPSSKIIAYLVTFLVSLQPMFAFISAITNIDIMVVFAFLLFLYFAIDLLKLKETRIKIYLYLLIISSLAPLIKPQLIVLVPLYIFLLFLKRKLTNRFFIFTIFLIFLPSIIWFLYKYSLEGAHFLTYPLYITQQTLIPIWKYPFEFVFGKQPIGIFMSFWGFFGWLDVPMPKWAYLLFLIFIVISLFNYWVNWKRVKAVFLKNKILLMFFMITVTIYTLSIFIFDIEAFMFSHMFVIQGRHLAPILPVMIIFLIQGLLLAAKSRRKVFIVLTLAIFILAQSVAFIVINHHYYGSIFLPKISSFKIYKL